MSYQPQSHDTHPEIDKFLMQAFRQMPAWKKAHLVNEATRGIQQWAIAGIRHQHPNATTAEIRFHLAARWLGKETANRLYWDSKGQMLDAESIRLALRMAEILDDFAVPYLIGGSVASSNLRRTSCNSRCRYCGRFATFPGTVFNTSDDWRILH